MKYFYFLLAFPCFAFNALFAQVQPDHVVIVMLENHAYAEIHGNASAPYINSLLSDPYAAALTQSYALTHPSQPNYVMLFSGGTQGITNDNVPGNIPYTTGNLGASLLQKGFTFKGYSETMPSVGYTNATAGAYARKHNPWVNWQGTSTNGIPMTSNLPFTYFPTNFDSLPTLSFVIPNINNDMHSGSIATGDTWLSKNLDSYVQWCKTHNSLFILTFDEDDKSQSNQIFTLLVGANIVGGTYTQQITHYNLLRTLEDLYGLPYAGVSADSSGIKDVWRTLLPLKLTSFTAQKKAGENELRWQIAQNTGDAFFELQRSSDAVHFTTISRLAVTDNRSNYNFTDTRPNPAVNYYRLKIVTSDGNISYSAVKSINNTSGLAISIFPNPVHDVLTMNIFNSEKAATDVTISGLDGRILLTEKLPPQTGTNTKKINVSKLAKGTYSIKVSSATWQQSMTFQRL